MNIKYLIIWIVSAVIVTGTTYGQTEEKGADISGRHTITLTGLPSLKSRNEEILKEMRLIYTKPEDFKVVPKSECFDDNYRLRMLLKCLSNQISSDDEEFIAFYPLAKVYTEQDSIFINRMFPGSIRSLNGMHVREIEYLISQLYGDEAKMHWKDYVNYYPSAEAKIKFNADTAISYSAALDIDAIYRDKYTHTGALFLQKKGRGYIKLYFFYTDKAKNNIGKYIQSVETAFRYED